MALLAAALSALTLAASAAFAALVLARWRSGHRAHQLLWGAALALFALASLAEVVAALGAWSGGLYKAYFVVTAVMVGLMAAGTAHLVSKGLGGAFTAYTLVVGQAMALLVLVAGVDGAALASASAAGEVPTRALGAVGALHALVDVPAALLLVAAPLQQWRRTRRPHALLIALGAVVFTGVHSLASGAQTGLLSLSGAALFNAGSLVGLALLLAGYLMSREAPTASQGRVVPAG